ncbi:hypothetical protein LX36DRAFT_455735 [Colletotrichum falcatum]|nr:hypothetical protein LX36DRAFT_455735 [Colletotrichum falcatum]
MERDPPVCDAPQPCKCVRCVASGIKVPRGCVCVCVCVCVLACFWRGMVKNKGGRKAKERLVIWTKSRANDADLMELDCKMEPNSTCRRRGGKVEMM